jgi:hypothetical protein
MPAAVVMAEEKQGDWTTRAVRFDAHPANAAGLRTLCHQYAERLGAGRTKPLLDQKTQRPFRSTHSPSEVPMKAS